MAILLRACLPSGSRILDPFAGLGSIFDCIPEYDWHGIEIEPDWAKKHPKIKVGDVLKLPYLGEYFHGICCSPCYGNRMADHHEATDRSHRITYRHGLGKPLQGNNSGQMQWGPVYRAFHRIAWKEVDRVLKPGGAFLLNTKNHIRQGEEQKVTEWHQELVKELGYAQLEVVEIPLRGNGYGQNGQLRVGFETITVFMKGTVDE